MSACECGEICEQKSFSLPSKRGARSLAEQLEKEFNIVQDLIDKARSSPGAANDVLRNCRGILSQAIS